MTRRELQELVGFDIGPKMVMVAGPDGSVYGRCEDGSWDRYSHVVSTGVVGGIPVTPEEDAAWEERGDV